MAATSDSSSRGSRRRLRSTSGCNCFGGISSQSRCSASRYSSSPPGGRAASAWCSSCDRESTGDDGCRAQRRESHTRVVDASHGSIDHTSILVHSGAWIVPYMYELIVDMFARSVCVLASAIMDIEIVLLRSAPNSSTYVAAPHVIEIV